MSTISKKCKVEVRELMTVYDIEDVAMITGFTVEQVKSIMGV